MRNIEEDGEYSDAGGEFVVGRVVAWHVADAVMSDGHIDTALLRPIARLGGPQYGSLGEITVLPPVPAT